MSVSSQESSQFEEVMSDGSDLSLGEGIEKRKEKLKKMMHAILGMSGDQKPIDKICCFFNINRRASASRQLITSFSLFLTLFMAIILAFFIFIVKFTPGYIGDSLLRQVDQAIEQNLHNSLQSYSSQVQKYFSSQGFWLQTFSALLQNQAGWSNSLFENTPPLKGKKRYFQITEFLPADLLPTSVDYLGQKVSLDTFSYYVFNKIDYPVVSDQTLSAIDNVDVISYFFTGFFFKPEITNINVLYIYLAEREVICFFPGGLIYYPPYLPRLTTVADRPWYKKTMEQLTLSKNGVASFVITGPYYDLTSGLKTITYSYPIMNKDKTQVNAIINVDLFVNKYKQIYDQLETDDTELDFAIIDMTSGLVVNDCFKSPSVFQLNQTNVTGFTQNNWEEIKNTTLHPIDSMFKILNVNRIGIYCVRSFIIGSEMQINVDYMILAFGQQQQHLLDKQQAQEYIDQELYSFVIIIITILSIVWAASYIYIGILARYIVQPLSKLSTLAKGIYQSDQSNQHKNSTEGLKERLQNIKGADSNTKNLIDAFRNLVDSKSRVRKLPGSTFVDSYCLSQINNYPLNDYFGEMEGVKKQVEFLPDRKQLDEQSEFRSFNSQKIYQKEGEKSLEFVEQMNENNKEQEQLDDKKDELLLNQSMNIAARLRQSSNLSQKRSDSKIQYCACQNTNQHFDTKADLNEIISPFKKKLLHIQEGDQNNSNEEDEETEFSKQIMFICLPSQQMAV